ncbi:phospholipase D family protein [Haloarcula marina]|uniref:phospholipase D family protein n=1 Tax=Haloarcula marina TaxID=2961574 RepID=UPI0020B6EC42|nr:phospholipase D family protein [Halomicroarcula marina]
MSNLIYHSEESYNRGESPFDRAIRETADSEEVRIVCPYIGPTYVKSILRDVDEWCIITDVVAWVETFHGESREEIKEFIEENQDRIHHFRHIHAKVVLSDDSAVLGSANLTEKGVTGRTEMGVRFSEEEKIKELSEWFNRIWSESDPVDLEELDELVRTSPSASSTRSEPTTALSSDAPRVRASFVGDVETSTQNFKGVERDDDRRMTADRFFGGVDNRIENLRSMLEYVKEASPSESALWSWLMENTGAEKESTMQTYVRFVRTIGLISKDRGQYSITDAGDYYRESRDSDFLFRHLSENVKGFETVLSILSEGSRTEGEIQNSLQKSFPDYSLSKGVIKRHLEWLMAIRYIEESGEGYEITDDGYSSIASDYG